MPVQESRYLRVWLHILGRGLEDSKNSWKQRVLVVQLLMTVVCSTEITVISIFVARGHGMRHTVGAILHIHIDFCIITIRYDIRVPTV